MCPILLKSTKSGALVRQNGGAKLTKHYKKYINRVLMLVKVCEFAALGALCAAGVTLPILQLHLGSYPQLVKILGMLPSELNVFQVINKLPLYHICIATAESHFFLFSKTMPVAEIQKWDAAFGALLISLGFSSGDSEPCTIFQELLDVKNPKNIAARKVFAHAARRRGRAVGLAHVQNSTTLWDPANAENVRAGRLKGSTTKKGKGKYGNKNIGKANGKAMGAAMGKAKGKALGKGTPAAQQERNRAAQFAPRAKCPNFLICDYSSPNSKKSPYFKRHFLDPIYVAKGCLKALEDLTEAQKKSPEFRTFPKYHPDYCAPCKSQ